MTRQSLCLLLAAAIFVSIKGCIGYRDPRPAVVVVEDKDGTHIELRCPPGWQGWTEWHTVDGTAEEKKRQYLRDARNGVCIRMEADPAQNIAPLPLPKWRT